MVKRGGLDVNQEKLVDLHKKKKVRIASLLMLFGLMFGVVFSTMSSVVSAAGLFGTNVYRLTADPNPTPQTTANGSTPASSGGSSSSDSSSDSSDSSSKDSKNIFAEAAKKQTSATSESKYAGNVFARLGGETTFSSNQSVWQYGTSYDALYKVGGAYKDAAAFAYQMQQTGLDDNAEATDNGGVTAISTHPIAGNIMLAGYQANGMVAKAFAFVGNVMQALNVFAWLNGVSTGSGPLANTGLGAEFHQIYSTVRDLGLVVAALVCCAGVGVAIFGADTIHSVGSKITNTFWKFFMKYIVAFLMFAALAAGYGALATNVQHMCNDVTSANPVDYLISSHMVDFQDWAYRTRLSLSSGGNPSLNGLLPNTASTHATKYKTPIITPGTINAIDRNLAGLDVSSAVESNSGFTDGFTKADGSYMSPLMGSKQHDEQASTANQDSLWLLNQWKSGQGCTASGYASYAVSNLAGLPKPGKGESHAKALKKAIKSFGEALSQTPSKDGSDAKKSFHDCGISSSGDMPVSNGTLKASGNYFTSQRLPGNGEVPSNRNGGGLSTLGMYVYLSSTFDKTEMDYYDLSKGSNANVSAIHASVVIPNHGLVYWGAILQLEVLPFVMLLFGIICAWTMLTDLLMTLPKVFIESFATGFGAESGAAKAIGAIMQVAIVSIGSLAFYGIGMDILKLLLDLGSSMADSLNTMPIHSSLINSGVVAGAVNATAYGLYEIVTTALVGFFAYKIIKERRKLLDALVGMVGDGMKRIIHAVYGFGLTGKENHAGVANTYAENNQNANNGGDGGNGDGSSSNGGGRLAGAGNHGRLGSGHGASGKHGGKGLPGNGKSGEKGADSREANMGSGKDAANFVNDNSKNNAEKGNEGRNGDADSEVNGSDNAVDVSTDGVPDSTDLEEPGEMDPEAEEAFDDTAGMAIGSELLGDDADDYEAFGDADDGEDAELAGDAAMGDMEDRSQNIDNAGDANEDQDINQGDNVNDVDGDNVDDMQYDENGNPLSVDESDDSAQNIDGSTNANDNSVSDEASNIDQSSNEANELADEMGAGESAIDNAVDGATDAANVAEGADKMAQLDAGNAATTANGISAVSQKFATSADSASVQKQAIDAQNASAGEALSKNGYSSMNDATSRVGNALSRQRSAELVAHDMATSGNQAQQMAAKQQLGQANQALTDERKHATNAWAHQSMENTGFSNLMSDRVASQSVSNGQAYKALSNVASSRQQVRDIQNRVRQSGVPISQQSHATQRQLVNAVSQFKQASTTASQMGLRNSVINNASQTQQAMSGMRQNLSQVLNGGQGMQQVSRDIDSLNGGTTLSSKH